MSSSFCHLCVAVLFCFASIERMEEKLLKCSAAFGVFYYGGLEFKSKVVGKVLSEESVDIYLTPQKPVFLGIAKLNFVQMVYKENGSCSESNTSFFIEPAILSVAEGVRRRGAMPTTSPVEANAQALPEAENYRGVETVAAQLDMLITQGRHLEAVRGSRNLRPMSPVFRESPGGRALSFTTLTAGPRPVPLVMSLRELHIGSGPTML